MKEMSSWSREKDEDILEETGKGDGFVDETQGGFWELDELV